MKNKAILTFLLGLVFSLSACAQEASEQAAEAADAAVHAAEVASANVPDMDERLANGERLYVSQCAACHQASGAGLTGAFPPLIESDYFAEDSLQGKLPSL